MKIQHVFICISLILTSCASVKPLQAITDVNMNTIGPGDDGEFKDFVEKIGNDASLLMARSNEWNAAEAAFGVGMLASAAYGAYNTTYSGDNLKDAAFAAASLAGLKGFLRPPERRDAIASAASRMSCLYTAAQTFVGPQTTDGALVDGLSRLTGAAQMSGFSAALSGGGSAFFGALSAQSGSVKLADAVPVRGDSFETLTHKARLKSLEADIYDSLVDAKQSEDAAYAERFANVASVYRSILAEMYRTTKFSAGSYADLQKAYTNAVTQATKNQEKARKASVGLAARTQSNVGVDKIDENLKKYAEAKVAVLSCGPKS